MKKMFYLIALISIVAIASLFTFRFETDFDRKAMDFIRVSEGVKLEPYKDTHGYWTIGVGHYLGKHLTIEAPLTQSEVEHLFRRDYYKHLDEAREIFPKFDSLNDEGKIALVDMTFNMGRSKFNKNKWPNFFGHIEAGRFKQASVEAKDSLWCKQVKSRCGRVTDLISKAEYK